MRDQKARTMTAAMKRALEMGTTPPAHIDLPEDHYVDARHGDPRPWYDRLPRTATGFGKGKVKRTSARVGSPDTANQYRKGFSGGVGRKPKGY